jgi:WD40 repeat protein
VVPAIFETELYFFQKSLRSVAWYSDGKQFVSSHQDGSLSVWNIKNPQRPLEMFTPHSNGTVYIAVA